MAMASPPYAPRPKKGLHEYLNEFITRSTVAANLLTLACFVAFALLIGFDVLRAFKKRATWLPGKAFALSGVTVQIIVWWTSLSNIQNGSKTEIFNLLWNHYIVVSGRVAVCVFIGYLLPGMAAPSVRVFAALAITICAQIASELVILFDPSKVEEEYLYSPDSRDQAKDFCHR
ncbi:hypothetical protein SUGI_0328530 [Cryptomeria japonica]|nr:hypothetical protein SUGI_0328530 [Cryptomeria japonica]